MRINKYLSKCGLASRRKCEELILNGKIKINGKICKEFSYDVKEDDEIIYNNKRLLLEKKLIYYKFYKPVGVVTSMSDEYKRKDIKYYINKYNINKRVFPIGRLDLDSEGLLILTNDGNLSYFLMHPKFEIEKKYLVKIKDELNLYNKKKLERGILLEEGKTSKCIIKNIKKINKNTQFEMIIHQGWKRQIRRMVNKINSEVIFLKRTSIGNITIGNMKAGEIEIINPKDIKKLTETIL